MEQHWPSRVLDCLLNRGTVSPADTAFFEHVKHEDLVNALVLYLNAHRRFLGSCQIESTHALNDRGVDVIVKAGSGKIGFQIKSHFDVTEKDFSRKVKAQFTEALSYGLDHYYVMFCCAMIKDGSTDYGMKVTHLRNELGLIRNVSFSIYGPQITGALFRNPPTLTRHELFLNEAVSDDALHNHELGYEHLPVMRDDELTKAEEALDVFGDEWFDSKEGQRAFDSYTATIVHKQTQQFTEHFLPTLPADIREQRASLVSDADCLLLACRKSTSWNDRSEYKLGSWIEHVPEEMIPYTSLPNLLKIRDNLLQYLRIHQKMDAEKART